MTLKRPIFIVAALLLALLTLVSSITNAQDGFPPGAGEPPITGDTGQTFGDFNAEATAEASTNTSTADSSISALGSIEPNQIASLQFQTTGTVGGVYVEVGNYIEAGEVVADLESEDAWNSYNQAVLNLESVTIVMDELMQPPSEDDLAVARANVTNAQAGYSSTANSTTDAQIESAQLNYDKAALQLQALEDARRHMSGTDEEITLAEAQIGAAAFSAEIARLQLEELQTPNSSALWSAGIRIQQAELQLEQLQEGPTQAEIASVQLSIDRAQASVLNAQTALQQVQLIAPISGYVTAVNIVPGDAVTATTIAIEISDLSLLRMTVPVNELDIDQISEGMAAIISLDALPDLELPGQVEHVGWISATSTDGIVTYDVRVIVNTKDAQVRIGMTGEVTIETGITNS